MIAFVLSGAGNRGPLQVGALRGLLEAGIEPDFIVGTSAGAINAAFVGARGLNQAALDEMATLWRGVTPRTVYPGGVVQKLWRVLRRANSLYRSDGLARLIGESLGESVRTFRDFQIPVYVTAVDLLSARLFVFGEDTSIEAAKPLLASASVPVIHPPVKLHGLQLVDGGVLANVAASFAMDKGATEIYALNAGAAGGSEDVAKSLWDVAGTTLSTMLAQAVLRDLDRARIDERVDLHHIHLTAFRDLSFRDFTRSAEMITAGYDTAKAYLAAPAPLIGMPEERPTYGMGEVIPGAREYYPPYTVR